MIAAAFRWLFGWLTGGGGIAAIGKELRLAREASLNAATESERTAAGVEAKRLETILADRNAERESAKDVRLATASFWEMRALTVAIALPFVVHLWGVWLDTQFGFAWSVSAFPPPFNEWQGAILLSFFGLSAGVGAAKAFAGAWAYRGRK